MKTSSLAHLAESSQDGNPVVKILRLLGDVILIPNYPLTKKPIEKKWPEKTLECMKDRLYLQSFHGKNIGVLLGKVSGGLCTYDVDDDAKVEAFLADNPRMRDTTRTKRVRGCNFWFYIDGEYPPNKAFPFGEWRADGNQTLIYGRAIDKRKGETAPTEYKFLNEVPPIHIKFEEIVFPKGCFEKTPTTTTIRLNPASCIATSLHSCVPASLHNKAESVLENIKAKKEAIKTLAAKYPNLVRIYTDLIEPRYQAQAHARNAFILQAVPFLYRVVAPQFVLELVGCFYKCNRALFNDTLEQHMKEANAMLESVATTYLESLNAGERDIYENLTGHEQEAFRICRDLALLQSPDKLPGTFYMSFGQLGDRVGVHPTQAQRVMRRLQSYGLVDLLEKGTRRAAGVGGKAGIYQWLI